VQSFLKAFWFSVAVNAVIALAELVAAPIHASGRAQPVLGYYIGAAHILSMPGFTFSGLTNLRYNDTWTRRGFAAEMLVNLAFWTVVGLAYTRMRRLVRVTPIIDEAPAAPEPMSPRTLSRRTLLVGGGRALAASGFGLGAYGVLAQTRRFEVTRRQVLIKGLHPALDGLRIVHLTDVHHSRWTSVQWLREIVQTTNGLAPDVVALTGDYVYRGLKYVHPAAIELSKLKPKIATLGVMGNHDWWQNGELTKWAYAKEGIPLIDNARRFITPDRKFVEWSKSGLCLAGVGDFWDDVCLYDDALGGVTGGMPRLLLSHNPDVAEDPKFLSSGHRVDLMLSGHTHGGQIRLPVIGTPVTNSRYGQKYARGLVEGPLCPVYVSKGLGTTAMPVRFGVRAEIAVIELKSAPTA
jgi:predicted MPP superfamily phosphohydrolase